MFQNIYLFSGVCVYVLPPPPRSFSAVTEVGPLSTRASDKMLNRTALTLNSKKEKHFNWDSINKTHTNPRSHANTHVPCLHVSPIPCFLCQKLPWVCVCICIEPPAGTQMLFIDSLLHSLDFHALAHTLTPCEGPTNTHRSLSTPCLSPPSPPRSPLSLSLNCGFLALWGGSMDWWQGRPSEAGG